MITKYDEWSDETQRFVTKSVYHVIDKSGYVVDNILNKRIVEDNIFDLIYLYKCNSSDHMDIDAIIDVLENKMPDMNYIQILAIDSAIWYLNHGQMD